MAAKNYGLIRSQAELDAFVDKLIEVGLPFGLDIETGYVGVDRPGVSVHPDDPDSMIVGISFSGDPAWGRYVPIAHDFCPQNILGAAVARSFWRLLATGLGVIHNAAFELRFMSRWFMELLGDDPEFGEAVRASNGYFPFIADTMLESYLLAGNRSHALKAITKETFDHDQPEISSLFPELKKGKIKTLRFNVLELTLEVIAYCCEDAAWALAHHNYLYPLVKDMFLYPVEHMIVPILCAMEDYGLHYDWVAMARKAAEANAFLEKLDAEIQRDLTEMTGQPQAVNIGSPMQLRVVLYDQLGFKTTRKTDTGQLSTDEQALTSLAKRYPVVQKILDWKQLRKLVGTYLDKYGREFDYALDGRAHPHHMQAVVPSGRFAVSDPPYQQSPKKYHYALDDGTEFDCDFRTFIVAPSEHYILGFDFSQVELRMLAGASGEPSLIHAFENDEDVHIATAALMLGKPTAAIDKDERSKGKTLNFALLYGMGITSLAERLGVDIDEAERLNDLYFSAYSAIQNWVTQIQYSGGMNGFVHTRFGRKVTIWELQSTERWEQAKGQRLCVNAPIQGAAADYMKVAMIRAHGALKAAGLLDRVHLVMNIHDALEYYVHDSVDPATVVNLLAEQVTFPLAGYPKIVADWHMGASWGTVAPLEVVDGRLVPAAEPAPPPEPLERGDTKWEPEQALRPAPPVEGMPGTWSHCGNPADHAPHRHTVTMNEGPTPDVLCKGTPGDPQGDAPAGQVVYAVGDTVTVGGIEFVKHAEPETVLATTWQPAERRIIITLTEPPNGEQLAGLIHFLMQHPGENLPVLVLPEGELPLTTYRSSLGPEHQAQMSMIFGDVSVTWAPDSVDSAALAKGIQL